MKGMVDDIRSRLFDLRRKLPWTTPSPERRPQLEAQVQAAYDWAKIQAYPEWKRTMGPLIARLQAEAVATLSRRNIEPKQQQQSIAVLQLVDDMNKHIMEVIKAGRDADQLLKAMSQEEKNDD